MKPQWRVEFLNLPYCHRNCEFSGKNRMKTGVSAGHNASRSSVAKATANSVVVEMAIVPHKVQDQGRQPPWIEEFLHMPCTVRSGNSVAKSIAQRFWTGHSTHKVRPNFRFNGKNTTHCGGFLDRMYTTFIYGRSCSSSEACIWGFYELLYILASILSHWVSPVWIIMLSLLWDHIKILGMPGCNGFHTLFAV